MAVWGGPLLRVGLLLPVPLIRAVGGIGPGMVHGDPFPLPPALFMPCVWGIAIPADTVTSAGGERPTLSPTHLHRRLLILRFSLMLSEEVLNAAGVLPFRQGFDPRTESPSRLALLL